MGTSAQAAVRAIAEPRRRAILRLVLADEMTAGAIASEFDVTREAISQHLRVLKQAGLVAERKEGTRRYYRARPEAFAEVRPFLEEMWDDSLALLKAAAEQKGRRQRRGR